MEVSGAVVGWGVGGIEAEAVMLGQPLYMLMPQVVGFKLTGKGELFIRHVAGHEVAALIAYQGLSLAEAARTVVFDRIGNHGLGAGMVAVDGQGNIAAPFNTVGMHRGWVLPTGDVHVATHDEVACVARLAGGARP